MTAWDTERLSEIRAASTERLQAYVAYVRGLPTGATSYELRGVTLALNELDRRGAPEVRP